MSFNALWQGAIVALLVLWAVWSAFGRFAPRTRTRLQRALAGWLALTSHPQWMRDLGLRLQPPPDVASGCGSGCDSCDSCGDAKPAPVEKPMQFLPRK